MNSNSVDLNVLAVLGKVIQMRRKALGVYLRHAADCACISRATMQRIEKGKTSVSIGAYMKVCKVLGLQLFALEAPQESITPKVSQITIFDANRPDDEQIAIQRYPQLKELVWQLRDDAVISPRDALNIYERNWRFIDSKSLTREEQTLIEQLKETIGKGYLLI